MSHVQAPSRYTQAIKSVFQAYHQGAPGWGQGCRVPCEERGEGVRSRSPQVSWQHSTQLPFPGRPAPQLSLLPLSLTSHHCAWPKAALAPQMQEHRSVAAGPVLLIYPVPLRDGMRKKRAKSSSLSSLPAPVSP